MQLSANQPQPGKPIVTGPRDVAMRHARTCYDHFAGRLGVAITDQMIAMDLIVFEDEAGSISTRGIDHLEKFGITLPDTGSQKKSRRPICRPCLDWSERRHHIAGHVGAAICDHFISHKLVKRVENSRALTVTRAGDKALADIFDIRRLDA